MSEHKHTPGPWRAVETIGGYALIATRDGVLIAKVDCSISSNHWVKNIAESNANSRLISAAPELLEALENLLGRVIQDCELTHSEYGASGREIITQAKQAIAKALGISV